MPMSEAQRKAAGERLRLAREKKQALRDTEAVKATTTSDGPIHYEQLPVHPEAAADEVAPEASVTELVKQVRELQSKLEQLASATTQAPYVPQTPQVDPRGRLTGTFEKYVVDPKNYANPTARLALEPKLQRFAFGVNYELGWAITRTQYQTQDGINTVEPRFTVELIKVVIDEETGEPTTGRYVLRRIVLHEDPQAALQVAADHGLDAESFGGERQFLDEMRYLRIRDWLIDAFYPPKRTDKTDRKEAVIGNRVVQLYEVSSTDPTTIKFER